MSIKRSIALTLALLTASSAPLLAASDGIVGSWATSAGSIVKVAPCGSELCLTVSKISPSAPGDRDLLNPDQSLRSRSICGLRIGEGFKPDGTNTASGGHIYDPESGKTYNAKMERKGDTLRLRGYIGISLIGRTEVWSSTSEPKPCS